MCYNTSGIERRRLFFRRFGKEGLFQRKKKHPLFGGRIPPSCAYCQHNSGGEGQVACALRRQPEGEACKKYRYDPLLREPRVAPSLRTSQYRPEDFQL